MGDEVKFSIDLQRPTVQFVGGVKLEVGGVKLKGGEDDVFPANSTLKITTLRGEDLPTSASGDDNAVVLVIPATEIDTRVLEGASILTLGNQTSGDDYETGGVYTAITESILKVFQKSALATIELRRSDVVGSLSNEETSANFEGDNVKFYLLAFTADDAGNLANAAYFTSVLAADAVVADLGATPPVAAVAAVVVDPTPLKYIVDSAPTPVAPVQEVEDIRIEVASPDSGTVIKIGDVIDRQCIRC